MTATAQRPDPRPFAGNEHITLERCQGALLISPAQDEARLCLLMRAADQMFARAEATLRRTPYRVPCYHKENFYPKSVDILPGRSGYYTICKQFLCYVFRVLATRPSRRRRIYGLRLRPNEVQMMEHILSLLDAVESYEQDLED